jgi:hypothetical protein
MHADSRKLVPTTADISRTAVPRSLVSPTAADIVETVNGVNDTRPITSRKTTLSRLVTPRSWRVKLRSDSQTDIRYTKPNAYPAISGPRPCSDSHR